ncbi:hypothetical protein COW53_06920 [bacterium CG17_big_fil_post_rev_8_21_14_2_50_64_8]|nr:MAG: hypothetical protein COW53_06920 [bacterium CG17_big_fil_post_rev_8_21_14_2_50_64_8]PJA74254.1 MAG: hypothetical protein CO151_10320 [bacterium CG_4_9_14_3_um_filter_65_15]
MGKPIRSAASSCADVDRRRFLMSLGLLGLHAGLGMGVPHRAAAGCTAVEYAGALDEVLFVYDQSAAPHLLRQIVTILRHLPPSVRVHVLVSKNRTAEAGERLRSFGLDDFHLLVSDAESVAGDWGRDILQLGCDEDGRRLVCVPWNKSADSRDDLLRGVRHFKALEQDGFQVRLLPVAAEGGNLMVDRVDGRSVLFAGTTIVVETRAMYRAYYGTDPGPDGVAAILRDGLNVDEVVWLGPQAGGEALRQAALLFHIDMGCTLVAPGTTVVARCAAESLDESRHRAILAREAERTAEALAGRGVTPDTWPEGLDLPPDKTEREAFLDARTHWERAALRDAARDMELIAAELEGRGYEVHRLQASPERVRRFQSHTNVITGSDRLIMPLFPHRERVHGWVVQGTRGRDSVDLDLGLADSEFELGGENLAAYELYRRLHANVRTVRDYFYLAGGNVHCVIGRLS